MESDAAARLEALYDARLAPALQRLGRLSRIFRGVRALFTYLLLPVALTGALLLHFARPDQDMWILAPAGWLAARTTFQFLFDRRWKRRFKRDIVAPAIATQEALAYQAEGCVARELFCRCGLFPLRVDDYRGEDRVQGTVDGSAIEFCEITARHCSKRWSPFRRLDPGAWVTIFHGFLFVADFHKTFQGVTLVFPRGHAVMPYELARSVRKENRRRRQSVILEDPEFERLYEVFSDDQVESRYLLSPSLMRHLVEYRSDGGEAVAVSFSGAKIVLAISSSRDLFEPVDPDELLGLLSSRNGRDAVLRRLRRYLGDLEFGRRLLEELHLNTGIRYRPHRPEPVAPAAPVRRDS